MVVSWACWFIVHPILRPSIRSNPISHSSVHVYDYSSLHQTLKQQNVPQKERNKLENIMDELKAADPVQKKSLLEKGKAWIVKNQDFLGASASIVRKALGSDVG
jgi:hypothetical protein